MPFLLRLACYSVQLSPHFTLPVKAVFSSKDEQVQDFSGLQIRNQDQVELFLNDGLRKFYGYGDRAAPITGTVLEVDTEKGRARVKLANGQEARCSTSKETMEVIRSQTSNTTSDTSRQESDDSDWQSFRRQESDDTDCQSFLRKSVSGGKSESTGSPQPKPGPDSNTGGTNYHFLERSSISENLGNKYPQPVSHQRDPVIPVSESESTGISKNLRGNVRVEYPQPVSNDSNQLTQTLPQSQTPVTPDLPEPDASSDSDYFFLTGYHGTTLKKAEKIMEEGMWRLSSLFAKMKMINIFFWPG